MFRIVCTIFVLATFILPQPVLAKSKIDTARDYVTIGKTNEARNLLYQAILADPLDADVHYEAGLVYSQLGLMNDFSLAMENACKLKPSNCSKVADQQYAAGFIFLDKKENERASFESFRKSFRSNPNNRQKALEKLLRSGGNWLAGRNYKLAERYFNVLLRFDPQSQSKVADIYYERALKSSSPPINAVVYLFGKAVHHSDTYKKQAGDILAEMSKDDKYNYREKNSLKLEAKKYLNKDEMLAHFPPDFREFKVGRENAYTISNMKAGQDNGFYIRQPSAFPTWRYATSYGTGVKAVLRDGTEYDLANKKPLPGGDYDFKFVAYEDGARAKVWFEK